MLLWLCRSLSYRYPLKTKTACVEEGGTQLLNLGIAMHSLIIHISQIQQVNLVIIFRLLMCKYKKLQTGTQSSKVLYVIMTVIMLIQYYDIILTSFMNHSLTIQYNHLFNYNILIASNITWLYYDIHHNCYFRPSYSNVQVVIPFNGKINQYFLIEHSPITETSPLRVSPSTVKFNKLMFYHLKTRGNIMLLLLHTMTS